MSVSLVVFSLMLYRFDVSGDHPTHDRLAVPVLLVTSTATHLSWYRSEIWESVNSSDLALSSAPLWLMPRFCGCGLMNCWVGCEVPS